MIGLDRQLLKTIALPELERWQVASGALLARGVSPEAVRWRPNGAAMVPEAALAPAPLPAELVPASFLALARTVSFHRDEGRWALLYRMLWRIAREDRQLLRVAADADVARFLAMERAVRREAYRLKTRARFRDVALDGHVRRIAWHRPEHPLLRLAAPSFARRFSEVPWSLMTPDESAHWDGERLVFRAGLPRDRAPGADEVRRLWRRHFTSVPAPRLPSRRRAPRSAPAAPAASPAPLPRCGPRAAELAAPSIALVDGGPADEAAGRVLQKALAEAGLPAERIYHTRAVHPVDAALLVEGGLRRPRRASAIVAGRPRLERELGVVRPRVLVCLGTTAATSVLGRVVRLAEVRGRLFPSAFAEATLVTAHPSAIAREEDVFRQLDEYRRLVDDFKRVREALNAPEDRSAPADTARRSACSATIPSRSS